MTSQLPVAPSLLEALTVEHGPTELIARFLLIAEAESRQRGISLMLGGPRELVAANAANPDHWPQLVTTYDPGWSDVHNDNLICLLGQDQGGHPVACHAVRLFDWRATNMAQEAGSMRLFHANPDKTRLPGERCVVTSQLAQEITGLVGFSGAAWCHPEYRRRGLSRILPLAAKAVALTRWNIEAAVAMMADYSVDARLPRNTGYPEMDFGAEIIGSIFGTMTCAVLRMPQSDIIRLMATFVSSGATEVDVGVEDRRTKENRSA